MKHLWFVRYTSLLYTGILSIFFIAGLFFWGGVFWLTRGLPTPEKIKNDDCFVTHMHQVYLCSKDPSYLKLSQISPYLIQFVVLSEDSQFWNHNGFDFHEILESWKTNQKKGFFARGGSTITQQLARNLYLTKEKTLIRKMKEAYITVLLEKKLSKKQILEKYLNVIEWGPNIFGAEKAAQYYFQKSAKNLTPLEAAFLTMLIPNPTKHSASFRQKELTPFAKKRVQTILQRAYQTKKIDEITLEESLAQLDSLWSLDDEIEELEDFEE